MNKNILIVILCLAIGFGLGWAVFHQSSSKLNGKVAGAAGNLLAEQYDTYVQYNGGYNSAKPMNLTGTFDVSGIANFTGNLGVSSSTPAWELGIQTTSGTSTLGFGTGSATVGNCIQFKTSDGKNARLYASTTPAIAGGTAPMSGLVFEAGKCE